MLTRLFSAVRRAIRAAIAPFLALCVLGLVARGSFATPGLAPVGVSSIALVVALGRLVARARIRRRDNRVAPMDAGAAAVFVALAHAAVAATGVSGQSPLLALPILVVAGTAALGAPRGTIVVAFIGMVGEAAVHVGAASTRVALATRLALVLAAATLHHVLTRGEIARVRAHAERLLSDERVRQRDAARSFRLIAAPTSTPHAAGADDDRRVLSSLDEIREALGALLEIVRHSMQLKTCAVYWLDAKGEHLRPVALKTDDDDAIASDPIAVGAGAVGGACAMGRPVILSRLRSEYGGLTYYHSSSAPVRSFAALPILDDGNVRGVMVADRVDDRPFDDAAQETLGLVAAQALRHVHNERVFGMLEKSKDELAKLFAASRALGEALTEDEVLRAVVASARTIVDHDLLVLAVYDAKTQEHRVKHASGAGIERLSGLSFGDNSGIASAAVKMRHTLPYRGHFDARTQYVFTRHASLEGNESVLCVPLVVHDHVLGTLTLAAKRRGAFPDATRQLLGVLASHASVALSNASAVRRLEELATTDPMTGLLNKRSLEIEFERKVRSAARFGKPLSLLVADIDKFKSVNDTYGHSVGDVVIKGLGAILARCKRETDIVARFGGEEFVVVCEHTEIEGAFLLAERIRTELGKTVFSSEMGPLSVTCSLGVAEFPRDGETRGDLFSRADEALYEAKRNGRNQTRIAARRSAPVVPVARKAKVARGVRSGSNTG